MVRELHGPLTDHSRTDFVPLSALEEQDCPVPKSEQWDTLTRSQYLSERGYLVESLNCSTPDRSSTVHEPAERECAICRGPVPPDRPKNSTVCGKPECREAWRLAQRRRRYADGREPPATIFELVSRTGAELVSVELVLGGERWLLTRQG